MLRDTSLNVKEAFVTVSPYEGAPNDRICFNTATLQHSYVVGEVPQCEDSVWGVDSFGLMLHVRFVVQFPVDTFTFLLAWFEAHNLNAGSPFNKHIFGDNIAVAVVWTCKRWLEGQKVKKTILSLLNLLN